MAYVIKNWARFQHYKNRRPPWIKLYTEIIEEFKADGTPNDMFALPDDAKLTFLLATLLASHFDGHLPDKNASWFAGRLGIHKANIKVLIEQGFIDASNCASTKSDNPENVLCPERENRVREREQSKRVLGATAPSDEFLSWYKSYPRPEARKDAWVAWTKLTDQERDECKAKTPGWVTARAGTEKKYIPMPATFLNARRWQDEVAPLSIPAPVASVVGVTCKFCQVPMSRKEALESSACPACREKRGLL